MKTTMKTTIYTRGSGQYDAFNDWCEAHCKPMRRKEAWWFPEIKQIKHGHIPVHPHDQIEMVPDMIGKRIVTLSEHIILAFQKLVRIGLINPDELYLYCGNTLVEVDEGGNLVDWPGPFFNERLALLR